jgi:hypothetical protein
MTWNQTFTGLAFDLKNPKPENVDIRDIAHHLAHQNRFYGATRVFYSVAQHSVHVSELVPEELRKPALGHDSPEAYVGDWSRPLKVLLKELGAYETINGVYKSVAVAVGTKLGIDLLNLPPEVRHADNVMLATEKRDLLGPPPQPWVPLPEPRPQPIEPWSASYAEMMFMDRWLQITGGKWADIE